MSIYRFGDNIDTDVILPGQFLSVTDPNELKNYCMNGYDPKLAGKLKDGDIFIAGKNFGCGSSREGAPASIRAAGVKFIIAKSFARIFYRNAINIGMPVLESEEAVNEIGDNDEIQVDLGKGIIKDVTTGKEYFFPAFPENLLAIIESGGLKSFYKKLHSK